MIGFRKLAHCAALAGFLVCGPATAQTTTAAAYLKNPHFFPAFDMYWRARLIRTDAGNRACSFPNKLYDDPKSPFRPVAQRLDRAGQTFETLFPGALNTVARPYQMPPSQSLCSDEKAAWEALFGFETAVVALENLLNIAGGKRR